MVYRVVSVGFTTAEKYFGYGLDLWRFGYGGVKWEMYCTRGGLQPAFNSDVCDIASFCLATKIRMIALIKGRQQMNRNFCTCCFLSYSMMTYWEKRVEMSYIFHYLKTWHSLQGIQPS